MGFGFNLNNYIETTNSSIKDLIKIIKQYQKAVDLLYEQCDIRDEYIKWLENELKAVKPDIEFPDKFKPV